MKELLFLFLERIDAPLFEIQNWINEHPEVRVRFWQTAEQEYQWKQLKGVDLVVIHGSEVQPILEFLDSIEKRSLSSVPEKWLVTPCTDPTTISTCFERGVRDVLQFPLSIELLEHKLTRFFEKIPLHRSNGIDLSPGTLDPFCDFTNDAIFLHPFLEHRFAYFEKVNRTAINRYGYSQEEFKKRTVTDITISRKETPLENLKLFQRLKKGEIVEFESVHVTKSGKAFEVEINSRIIDIEGKPYLLSAAKDISKRVAIQKELKTRDSLLTSALSIGKMAYWRFDLNRDLLIVNDEFYDLFGTTAQEHGGYQLSSMYYAEHFLHPEDQHLVFEEIEHGMKSPDQNYYSEFNCRIVRKNGSLGYMYIRYNVYLLENGEKEFFGICQDVTDQKVSEIENQEILQRQQITQKGIDLSNFPIFQINDTGDIDYANDCACATYGYSKEELQSMHITAIDRTSDKQSWIGQRAITREMGGRAFESIHTCRDGRKMEVEISVRYFEFNGKLMSFSFVKDLTEQKNQQRKLEENERRFRLILTNTPGLGVHGLGQDGNIFFWNDANTAIFGYTAEEAMGKNVMDLIHHQSSHFEIKTALIKALETGGFESREIKQKHKNGSDVYILHTGVFLEVSGRKEFYSLSVDMTKIRKAELEKEKAFQAITMAKEQAERANRAKDDFLTVMSHEMRTPLNPIIGFSDMIRQNPDDLKREYIEIIHDSGMRLQALINDVLDYTLTGKEELHPDSEDFQLIDVFQNAFLKTKQIKPDIDYRLENGFGDYHEIPIDFVVHEDPQMIGRILDNLLTNACKYTRKGSITLRMGLAKFDTRNPRLKVEVSDTGIGIEESMLPTLFEPFTQADKSFSRETIGIGLGLSICKRLITLLGGKIEVDSKLSKGSTFAFEFPISPINMQSRSEDGNKSFQWHQFKGNPKVLIVDDTANNSKIASVILSKMGIKSVTAGDGLEAVERSLTQAFDLILMDLSMPHMDGIEATRKIREIEGFNREIPIIGLSAHVSQNVEHQCLEAGMNDYLEKPINSALLQQKLKQHLLQ